MRRPRLSAVGLAGKWLHSFYFFGCLGTGLPPICWSCIVSPGRSSVGLEELSAAGSLLSCAASVGVAGSEAVRRSCGLAHSGFRRLLRWQGGWCASGGTRCRR